MNYHVHSFKFPEKSTVRHLAKNSRKDCASEEVVLHVVCPTNQDQHYTAIYSCMWCGGAFETEKFFMTDGLQEVVHMEIGT